MRAPAAGQRRQTIRQATASDLEAVAACWTALVRHHATRDPRFRLLPGKRVEIRRLLRTILRDPDSVVLVAGGSEAARPEAVAGLCVVRVDRAPPILEAGARAEITELFVHEPARRQGLARALVRAALVLAKERGAQDVEVRVSVRNSEGQAFWRSVGFQDWMDVLGLRL